MSIPLLKYIPLQPTIRQTGNVSYKEIPPDPRLKPFIHCYWELKTMQALTSPFNYRVVADACMDIFFELQQPAQSFAMGFCRQYTEFPLANEFHYVGIRFFPTMFPQVFSFDASLLSNSFERLEDITPGTASFISSRFNQTMELPEIKAMLDVYFLNILSRTQLSFDKRLYKAVDLILSSQGTVNIETDIDTGISPRQLRRLFHFYIGDTAKTFSKVVRFQHILQARPSTQSLRKSKLFFDAGFYDQAHFIKDFKNFYGDTPSQAFK